MSANYSAYKARNIEKMRDLIYRENLPGLQYNFTEDLFNFTAFFNGPNDTPYEGGVFKTLWHIPEEFPFKPPRILLETKIFHPNMDPGNGKINLDVINDQWSPALMFFNKILLSIQSLLDEPDVKCPLNFYAAYLYANDRSEYIRVAKDWTYKYALDNIS